MTFSSNGWSSDHDLPSAPQTTEDYEFNQSGKVTKTIIGIGLMIAFGIALTFFHVTGRGASTPSSPMASDSAHSGNFNSAPGRTTGQAPSTSAH